MPGSPIPSPPPFASATVAGLVSIVAQTLAGFKAFQDGLSALSVVTTNLNNGSSTGSLFIDSNADDNGLGDVGIWLNTFQTFTTPSSRVVQVSNGGTVVSGIDSSGNYRVDELSFGAEGVTSNNSTASPDTYNKNAAAGATRIFSAAQPTGPADEVPLVSVGSDSAAVSTLKPLLRVGLALARDASTDIPAFDFMATGQMKVQYEDFIAGDHSTSGPITMGTCYIGAGLTSVTITDAVFGSFTGAEVFVTKRTLDASLTDYAVSYGIDSFTITGNAAAGGAGVQFSFFLVSRL